MRHANRLREALVILGIFILTGLCAYQWLSVQFATERFHYHFYASDDTWRKNRWLGILTQQNPNDVWIIQEIISEVRPDVILETGSYYGGSAAVWATILEQVNPSGQVISIDIDDLAEPARRLPIVKEKVRFLVGSSTAPEIVQQVEQLVGDRKAMVILDSNHEMDHVLREMNAYASLIPVGGYLIVQDTNMCGHPIHVEKYPGNGPMEAVDAFLATNDRFESDRSRERLMFTMHPKGYLKRVR